MDKVLNNKRDKVMNKKRESNINLDLPRQNLKNLSRGSNMVGYT